MQLDEVNVKQFAYLAAAPELRYTPSGKAVANFRALTTNRYKDKEDQQKERTTGVRWEIWDKGAETLAKLLKKGSHVYVEGVMHNDSFDDPKHPGETVYRDRFIVRKWKLLDRKEQGTETAVAEGTGGEPGDDVPPQSD